MFEVLLKELKELAKLKQITVPINADQDGYLDKECPGKECNFIFKVHKGDWANLFKKEKVYCPMCRHEAESEKWWTNEQLTKAKNKILKHFHGRIEQAIKEDELSFNNRPNKGSFVSMSFSFSKKEKGSFILPVPAMEEMILKITCKSCAARYSVIGSAFFCPSCGHNCAEETLDNSLKKIDSKIKNLSLIRRAIETISKDEAETTCRSLIESSLNECVVAFQRFCEISYLKINPAIIIKRNSFQNLEMGGKYWKLLYGNTYTDWLTETEYNKIKELFHKRHLLSHTEGIVDQSYLDKSADKNYIIGQRIVVKEEDVIELKDLIIKITDMIRTNRMSYYETVRPPENRT